MKKTILAVAISALLAACGGGGSSTPPPVTVTPTPTPTAWSLTKLSAAGNLDMALIAPSNCVSFDIVGSGDLNNDGHDDIILGPKVCFDSNNNIGYAKLVIAFYDTQTKTFKVDYSTQAKMPEMQWVQFARVGDFNNDGYNDLFVVGTGPDQGQPCGEAPSLILGSKNGLVDMSHLLPRMSMYAHQAAVGDFNSDGKIDFIILNNNWVPDTPTSPKAPSCSYRKHPGTNQSFIITSTADSWTFSTLNITDSATKTNVVGNNAQNYSYVTAGDINNDGKLDLVIFGGKWSEIEQKNYTLFGDGTGKFEIKSVFSETPYGADTVSANAILQQIDEKGSPELLVNYTKHPGGQAQPFQHSIYRIFKFDPTTNNWTNTTDQYLTNKTSVTEVDLIYCLKMQWVDVNNDGMNDLVCSTINPFKSNDITTTSPRIWLRTTDGKLEPAYHSGFDIANSFASMTAVKIDSKYKVVGIKSSIRSPILSLQIAE